MIANIIIKKKKVEWLEIYPENEGERKKLRKVYSMQPVFVGCGITSNSEGNVVRLTFSGKQ